MKKKLLYGSLPYVYLSSDPWEELKAYISSYLILEVQTEGFVRSLPLFQKFLKGSALTNTQILNFSKIASDFGLSASSVRDYYGILRDLHLGWIIEPWKGAKMRKPVSKSKFYFFDIGLVHALCGVKFLNEHSDLYGKSFEHFIASEIRAYLSYFRKDDLMQYWQSRYGNEVDFIIGDHTALEVKATDKISNRHLKSLQILKSEKTLKHFFVISQDKIPAHFEGIQSLYWKDFLIQMWSGQLF